MEPMNHQVWQELEKCFQLQLRNDEKNRIAQCVKNYLAEHPNLGPEEMGNLVLQVTQEVLDDRAA